MPYIKVGPFCFTITEVDRLMDETSNKKLDGLVDYGKSLISIDSALSPQVKQHAIWHEAIHAILTQYNIELGEKTEDIINALASGIMELLEDNEGMRSDIAFMTIVRPI